MRPRLATVKAQKHLGIDENRWDFATSLPLSHPQRAMLADFLRNDNAGQAFPGRRVRLQRMKEFVLRNLTPRLVAATALALMMTEIPSIAAQSRAADPAVDSIVTGPAPQRALLLAQNEEPAADGEEPADEEGKPRKKRRQVEEAPAEQPAPKAAEPAPAPQAAEPAPEPQRQAEPEPEPKPKPRKQRAAEQEAPAEQPAQEAQPAQPAVEPPAEGQAKESPREKRQRERREAREKQRQEQAAEPKAEEQKPADTAEPAQPPAVKPPEETAQPAEPEQKPADTAQPQTPAVEPPPADTAQPQQPPATDEQPTTAQPGADKLPENAAPVLDSQKPAPGSDQAAQPAQPEKPPVAAGPPPASDAEAQKERVDVKEIVPVTKEEGRRVEGKEPPRRERREGVDVLREIGGRVIIDLGGRPTVESSDRPRMERGARETYYEELPRGRTRETIVRANGVQIVTVRDRYGEVIRRSRITPDGREYVLVYVDEDRRGPRDGGWRDPGDDLPPLVLDIPVDEYILDADDAEDEEAYYEFLDKPPVERVERYYSVDEVKRSARVRDSVRRVDLDTITFEFGSADIKEDAIGRLDGVAKAMAKMLEKNPAETFLIEGHTDAVGSDMANLALSDRRAEAVAAALTDVFEIPPENLTTQGYGEQYLKIKSDGPEEQNRRVAIRRITPLVSPEVAAKN